MWDRIDRIIFTKPVAILTGFSLALILMAAFASLAARLGL